MIFIFRSLDTVSGELSSLFKEAAEQLLEKQDAVEVLSKALALVSGNTEITSRSLLSAQAVSTKFHCHIKVIGTTLLS